METWMIFALLSAVTGWIYNFAHKVVAQRNYDVHLSTIYSYAMASFLAGIYCVFIGAFVVTKEILLFTLLLWWINIIFFYASVVVRVKSMRNIDTVIFFPLYKTFWPLMVTAISIFMFHEQLAIRDIMGIVFWIMVPLMLITRSENKIQKNLSLGVMLVLATAVLTTVSTAATKFLYTFNGNPELYLFVSLSFGTLLAFLAYHFHSKKSHAKYRTQGILKFSLCTWVIHVIAFMTFIYALKWNLAIAFTINSFSILIPIILSIIFYWEHFNLKKGIVIALSVVSILLFI